jgi:hypothetical protein
MHHRLKKFATETLITFCAVVTTMLILCLPFQGQTGNATLGGVVEDKSGAVIPHVAVKVTNVETGTERHATTNDVGLFSVPGLTPGRYSVHVEHSGFSDVEVTNITLNVADQRQLEIKLPVGNGQETVTVTAGGGTLNTTDAAVSTVIDRQFVQDMPMNGRSFQALVLLSPGVVTNTPQLGSGTPPSNDQGEYSVNGMRSDSNSFMVDGASASNSASNSSNAASAGMLASATALGTTHAMLSVDAMEEFRISTSTYSAEYGRQPGAQVSFRSRSGTNEYHGTAYDYLRNSAFDANNWFNTYSIIPVSTPAERQNDFGGTLGGPISVPHLYSGRDRTFFFFAYQGLRLDQPQPAAITYVPSNGTFNTATYTNPQYKNLRLYSATKIQPLLNAYPLPNCSVAQDPQCVDYGLGGSPYIQSPTSTGTINSISARLDYQLLSAMRIFARYSDTTSKVVTNAVFQSETHYRNRIYLLGADNTFGGNISNELRLQYSPALAQVASNLYDAGGAVPFNLNTAQGLPPVGGEMKINIELPNSALLYEQSYGSKQYQPNATDAITWSHGKHLFKAGADYRQTTAYYGDGVLSRGPYVSYTFNSTAKVLTNAPTISAKNYLRTDPTTKNLGLFVQDEWRPLSRLSVSAGLRWDLDPPPTSTGAQMYTYTGDTDDPSTLGISQPGAPLYKTTYTDFAPRLGVAVTIRNDPGHELVFRGGGGLFYDTIALNQTYGAGLGVGTAQSTSYTGTKYGWPATSSMILVPVAVTPTPPYTFADYPNNRIVPPPSIQWNASLEQAFGRHQTITMGYVASLGRKLPYFQDYTLSKLNPLFTEISLYQNGPGSNYNSLQVKYQRQMTHGLQVLASYTWSHAIDWASTEDEVAAFPLQRGNSNFDVRHNFTAAIVYNLPTRYENRFETAVLGHWNADLWFVARTSFPYEPVGPAVVDPLTGDDINGQLNYNGKKPYVHVAGIPGGRQIDPTIFSVTSTPLGAGNAPRNFLRGFGEAQANIAIQRAFPLYERTQLQFRAEAFNILNHPNFGTINTTCGVTTLGATCNNSLMGQASNTLSTGLGGLSSLYQQGGPRSLQFMLKLQF